MTITNDVVKDTIAQDTTNDTAKDTVQDTTKVITSDTVKDTTRETTNDPLMETVEDTTKDTIKDTTKDTKSETDAAVTSNQQPPQETQISSHALTQSRTPPQAKVSLDTSSTVTNNAADPTAEFVGDVDTDNTIPSQALIRRVADVQVLDQDGKSRPFKSLYSGPMVARRVLVIFVRHFFCGNCQAYLKTLSENITTDSLLQLPVPTFIAVVGCGSPALIPMYLEATGCPFPVYADPTQKLYKELGMTRTLALGPRPEYMRKSMLYSMTKSLVQGLKQIKVGLAAKAGDIQQVGGEFLFEPVGDAAASPLVTPILEDGEEKRVTWCHRMRNTRDHAEIPELREVLGFNGSGISGKNKRRWSRALETRKGSGKTSLSLERHDKEKLAPNRANERTPTALMA